ncbi:MAG: SMC-Scp complex subunit ScpB [Bacteroidetes bacterium]|nr:SMC-Scp complex subunit ScpB [Bacteroidota bacterium]MBS1629175.1 SMC-Scp complex subunit ScpB [Bacteroidota bacterium]
MNIELLMPQVEALIFASERPLTQIELCDYLGAALESPQDPAGVAACVEAIREKYDSDYYPFSLREIGGGYQFLTKKEFHKTILQLNGDKHIRKLSTAAMETLAIIAYKQPVTKGEIEYIRGVSADYSIQKLLEKELIVIAGRKEDAVGKPLIYTTSKSFMDYLGINSAASLPALRDILSTDVVLPTSALEALPEVAVSSLAVAENGELVGG